MCNRRVELKNIIRGISRATLVLLMSLVIPLTSFPVSAAENREILDPNRRGSISITFTYYDENSKSTKPVTGGNSVGLYKVADVAADNGFKFVIDERFAGAGEIPDTDKALDDANPELAKKMEAIADHYAFDVPSVETDSSGRVSFEGLEVGLYLVKQDAQGTGDNKIVISPFLISIPQKNTDGSLIYDVDAHAKPIGAAKEEVPPPPPPPTPPHLPQTGQLWRPVMILGGLGALMLCLGMIRKKRNEQQVS